MVKGIEIVRPIAHHIRHDFKEIGGSSTGGSRFIAHIDAIEKFKPDNRKIRVFLKPEMKEEIHLSKETAPDQKVDRGRMKKAISHYTNSVTSLHIRKSS